jgi:hypothetical protein
VGGAPVEGAKVFLDDLAISGFMRTTHVAESFTNSTGDFSFRVIKRLKEPFLIVKGWSRCRPGTEMPNGARVFALGSVYYRIKQGEDHLLIFVPADFQIAFPPQDYQRTVMEQMRKDAALAALRTQWTDEDRHSISNLFKAFLRAERRFDNELARAGASEKLYSGDNAVALKTLREALKQGLERNRTSEGVSDAVAAEIQAAIDRSEHTTKRIPGVVALP